ncbi:MAG TPA: hypothetical protein VJB92_01520 [Candidatus Paceibacterota bacterium]
MLEGHIKARILNSPKFNRGLLILTGLTFIIVAFTVFIKDEGGDTVINSRKQLGLITDAVEGYKKYFHPKLGFSFSYPRELTVQEYNEGDWEETIVFSHPKNGTTKTVTDKSGFQIFITPFEGSGLTLERLSEDLPETVIEESVKVILNPSASTKKRIEGLLFWSASPAIGKTRELWFPYEGYLYEITTYAHLDSWLAEIMDSWRFL